MQEVLGVFWPKTLFEAHFKRMLHPSELRNIRGMVGAILPEKPGENLPVGCFRMFNFSEDATEKKELVEDSKAMSSNLLPDQVSNAYDALCP